MRNPDEEAKKAQDVYKAPDTTRSSLHSVGRPSNATMLEVHPEPSLEDSGSPLRCLVGHWNGELILAGSEVKHPLRCSFTLFLHDKSNHIQGVGTDDLGGPFSIKGMLYQKHITLHKEYYVFHGPKEWLYRGKFHSKTDTVDGTWRREAHHDHAHEELDDHDTDQVCVIRGFDQRKRC